MADYESNSQHIITKKMKSNARKRKLRTINEEEEEEEGEQIRKKPSKSHCKVEEDSRITVPESEEAIDKLRDDSPWRNLELVLSIENNSIPLQQKLELAYNYVKLRTEQAGESMEEMQTVSFSRLLVFLSDWVQRVLVSSAKKGMKMHLNYRYWVIFKFCLEESKKTGVSLRMLRDLLQVIQSISGYASNHLASDEPTVSEESDLHSVVLDCISLVFSSHGGISNENLDSWISLIKAVLQFVQKVLNDKLDGTKSGVFAMQLTCYVLEPFVKFLKVHPTRKDGFSEFIGKLFEDLMILWDALDVSACESKRNLMVLIEEVLSQALFHPTHMDGFFTLQSTSKYKPSDDKKSKERTVIKSYHRHLFVKLKQIITERNASALCGVGELLRLFINCIYRENGVLVSTEARKSVFDFFVEIMELFLPEISTHSQPKPESGPLDLEVYSTLRSISKLLRTCVQEKVYVRTEDTSEGACFNFLKLIYDAVMSLTAEINRLLLSFISTEERIPGQLLILAAKEIFLAMHYLLDIEYEVVGDDLEKLWGAILTLTTSSHSLMNVSDQHLLTKEILKLGCRLVHLYSELRQVNIAIFSLNKAVREVVSPFSTNEGLQSAFLRHSFANSLSMLLCSPEFKLSVRNAVKSIPEGQASGCIRQLVVDITESLEWIKCEYQSPAESDFSPCFDLKVELLGKSLSEVYTLILDSMTVTTGNSNLLALSVKDLMAVIRPGLSSLVSQEPDVLNVFFRLVMGRAFTLRNDFLSVCWISVFFFRLYMSCRSLQRQAISLMPPDASKKMSKTMADSFSAFSAKDWLERTVWEDESYFSWVVQPSAPLLSVLQIYTEFCDQNSVTGCSPLIYVLSGMALQRLVDLNRQIRSVDYILQNNNKSTKRWKKHVSTLRKEAADLTEFLMSKETCITHLDETEVWDLSTSSIDEKLLPSALWWIMCQNVDIWSSHASKKVLKKFLVALIQNSRPCLSMDMSKLRNHTEKFGDVVGVNRHRVSVELLRNTILYEQRPICRHMASTFCKILKESVAAIFSYVEEVDLRSAPDWENAIHMLEKSSTFFFNGSLLVEQIHHLRHDVPAEACEQELSPTSNTQMSRCRTFLNLLSWIPKGCLSSKSFSLCVTSILNIDRLVVGFLFKQHSSVTSSNRYEFLRLLVTCRKTFKNLITASSEENKGHQSLLASLCSESYPVIWLLKSLSAITGEFSQETSLQMKHVIFSLMDHTAFILSSLIKDQFIAILALTTLGHEETNLKENGLCSDFSNNSVLQGSVLFIADTLIEHTRNLLDSINVAFADGKVGDITELQEMEKVSPALSCFQGFLCGLSSALDGDDVKSSSTPTESSSRNLKFLSKMKPCIEICACLINSVLHLLFLEGDNEIMNESQKISQEDRGFESLLADVDFEQPYLRKSLLQGLFDGENLQAAFCLRQIFGASSAILKLTLHTKSTSVLSSLLPVLIRVSQVVLLEFANHSGAIEQDSFILLDSVVKFIRELGKIFPRLNPLSSRDLFVKQIELHLKAIGRCITLQGKEVTLASREIESSTKMLSGVPELDVSNSHWLNHLDKLKFGLRTSFTNFVSKASELHLLSAIQAIERALVGVQEHCIINYEVTTGSSDGGKVSANVAAGIDCLDLILEFVTGRKKLATVKRHIQSLVSSLLNVVLHLQGPVIFFRNLKFRKDYAEPDSGSVCLMCISMLTKISAKHAFFQLEACHIGQLLHMPAAIFQNVFQLWTSKVPLCSKNSGGLIFRETEDAGNQRSCTVDTQFCIKIYAACCRILCTVLKHYRSETRRCIALLEDSVGKLLNCLEMVCTSPVGEGYFGWEVQGGVRCASFLRRVYEEIRQQKDVYGDHCSQFLSCYIWVYCGYGRLKNGIIREIDVALRPGIYALIDACSADDLQRLHTVFGEGPCRSTLASLQHDYKLHFQYEGKV